MWALVAATYAPAAEDARGRRKQSAAWAASGALFALAALMKPPLGGGALSSLVLIIAARRKDTGGRAPAPPAAAIGAFAGGGFAVAAAAAVYFAFARALPDLYDALAVFAPRYMKFGPAASGFPALLGLTLGRFAVTFSPAILIGFILFFLLPRVHARESEGAAHVLGSLAFSLLGIAWQAKLFHYHFGAALPMGGLIAGWAVWKLALKLRARWVIAAALVLAAAGAWLWKPAGSPHMTFGERSILRIQSLASSAEERRRMTDELASVADVDAAANRAAAEWISANTTADSRLFIWGFEPVIYLMADRRPASRYIYDVPLRVEGYEDRARAVLLRELEDHPPAAIAVESGDTLSGVTGSARDSRADLERFPELESFLSAGYVRAADLPKFTIWLKAPGDRR